MTKRRSYFLAEETKKPSFGITFRVGIGYTVVLIGTVGMAYGAFALGLFNTPPPLDPDTGCRTDIKTQHTTDVLIDDTDPFSTIHVERLKERLKVVSKSMPDYGLLNVFALNPDDPTNPRELFHHCAPRSPERTSAIEGGADYLRHQWAETFEKPLLASVEEIITSKIHAKRSPILGAIAGLTQRPDFDAEIPDRNLVLISDMVEHDDRKNGFSTMRGGDLVSEFHRSSLGATLHADLQNTTVIVDYLLRPEYAIIQNDKHLRFWRWWLTEVAEAKELIFFGIKEGPLAAANSNAKPLPNDANKGQKHRT